MVQYSRPIGRFELPDCQIARIKFKCMVSDYRCIRIE